MEEQIAEELGIKLAQVKAVVKLLNNGATIPFIARYRKEATGSLNEVDIEKIDNAQKSIQELEKRRATILYRLAELNITNENVLSKIRHCTSAKELEDLYLPYKQKKETRATRAMAKGLEPLARVLMSQKQNNIQAQAQHYASGRMSVEDALQGARDIMAEWINENHFARTKLRKLYQRTGQLTAKVVEKKKQDAVKYQDYFAFSQSIKRIPSHRLLAILRAEKEGFLKVKVEVDKDEAISILNEVFIKENGEAAKQIKLAVKDAYKRLIASSMENEMRSDAKAKADEEAIGIFTQNLNQLLLAAPLGNKAVLAIDPGFRTGCKVVCLSKQGSLVHNTTIFPHPPQNQQDKSRSVIQNLLTKYQIEAIAVGNGTAGRETEQFLRSCLPKDKQVEIYLISEDGASIYSASENGREEFPDLDLTVRGAISIGRRLMDPLAELVKIEPKSIGVGQYQHDVAQDKLKTSLDNTVLFAVNKVGVNVNTASKHLLQYVSGLGPKLAKNIVEHRSKNGPFRQREELLKIKGLGAKSFEQAAGFLRIVNGANPLDASAVHPERYEVVHRIAAKNNTQVEQLIGNQALLKSIDINAFVTDEVGLPTLQDIIMELNKPGLDMRGAAKAVMFDDKVKTIEDLRRNMMLHGKVTNLTKFGAFVDIGIKEQGLLHKSQLADRYIEDPVEVLKLNQEVRVRVLDVDLERKRIGLSLKLAD
ncbi:MAG: hypothetical protein RLZZ337_386 [Bacteroidota bacterium]